MPTDRKTQTKKKGSKQRRQSKHGRLHKVDLSKLYSQRQPPLHLSQVAYRITLLRANMAPLNIDGIVSSLEFREEAGDPVMKGSLNVDLPDPRLQQVNIKDGQVVRVEAFWYGRWREMFRMRLYNGQATFSGRGATWELADDGFLLTEGTDHFHYTKSKKKGHPKGWKAHEITRDIARRYRIKLGQVAEGKHWITDLDVTGSPMQALVKAWAIEKNASGRRFVFRWRNGKLNILPLKRNPNMYVLGPHIEDGTITKQERDEKFATAVTVRATVKKAGSKHKHEKLVVRYVNEAAVKKEGFIHRELNGTDVKDRADALRKAKRYIARHSVRKRVLTDLQHPLVPFVRRGDGMRASIPERGFYGERGVCFITSLSGSLQGGQARMTVNVTFDDPFDAQTRRKAKDKKTRDDKRKKR